MNTALLLGSGYNILRSRIRVSCGLPKYIKQVFQGWPLFSETGAEIANQIGVRFECRRAEPVVQ